MGEFPKMAILANGCDGCVWITEVAFVLSRIFGSSCQLAYLSFCSKRAVLYINFMN